MSKSADAFRTISEVADWLDTPTYVLRFWESRFSQISPVQRAGGRRYYRPEDMQLLGGIKKLLHFEDHSIKDVQRLLEEQGVEHIMGMSPDLDTKVVSPQIPLDPEQTTVIKKAIIAAEKAAPEEKTTKDSPQKSDVLALKVKKRADKKMNTKNDAPLAEQNQPSQDVPKAQDDNDSTPVSANEKSDTHQDEPKAQDTPIEQEPAKAPVPAEDKAAEAKPVPPEADDTTEQAEKVAEPTESELAPIVVETTPDLETDSPAPTHNAPQPEDATEIKPSESDVTWDKLVPDMIHNKPIILKPSGAIDMDQLTEIETLYYELRKLRNAMRRSQNNPGNSA